MVADLGSADPIAQLRIALAEFAFDPLPGSCKYAEGVSEGHPDPAIVGLFVQGFGEWMDETLHQRFTHSPSTWWSQRTLDS